MKYIISFFFWIIAFTAITQKSTYYPFPTGNTYWREVSDGYQCFQCCSEYQYILTGDTLINDFIYSKIEHSGVIYSQDMWGNCTRNNGVFFRNYKGALRNDAENRKVYYVQPWTDFEEVLYDFNLQVGDTLPPSFINPLCCGVGNMVTGIDSVLVGNEYHRNFYISSIFDPYPFCSIIEGVGSTLGLFGSMGYLARPLESGSVLVCMNVNGETVYPDFTTCELATAIEKLPHSADPVIFPNPAKDFVYVTLNHYGGSALFSVINLQGQEVISQQSCTDHFIIDISGIPSGIYFIRIRTGEVFAYLKFIRH